MPELMTIRRATAHGTDAGRTLATGFGAPQTIRPAGSPVAAPAAAVGGESRLWRRTVLPSGAVRSFGAPATSNALATVAAPTTTAAGGRPDPGSPINRGTGAGTAPSVRRTWQPWTDAPPAAGTPGSTPGTAPTTTFPSGPAGAASAPTGHRPAPDVRRMTVAPPRISVAPSQPPPPPTPEVARTPERQPPAPGADPVRRSTGGSLVDATAHLFASPDSPVVRRTLDTGGAPMSTFSQPAAPPPPPATGSLPVPTSPAQSQLMAGGSAEFGTIGGQPDQEPPGVAFDSLVDAVVQRIERRVVEELERRGRRTGRGQF